MKHLVINQTTQGFVYLIHQSNTPYFKIGTTQRDPYKRLRAMQTGNAMKLDMALIMEFQNSNIATSLILNLALIFRKASE